MCVCWGGGEGVIVGFYGTVSFFESFPSGAGGGAWLQTHHTRYVLQYYRRIPRLRPPPLCMLALGKNGEGAYTRDPNVSV